MTHDHESAAKERRQQALARVQKLLQRMRLDPDAAGTEPPREWEHPYVAGPLLTVPELTAWEVANGVALPEEYRLFLLEVGNGGQMPGGYCDLEVWPLKPGPAHPELRQAFPISNERLRERGAQWQPDDATFLPELDEYYDAGRLPPGCLEVARYPSFDVVSLVVTGELRGTLWCGVAGWRPEHSRQEEQPLLDFLTWFEETLLDLRGS